MQTISIPATDGTLLFLHGWLPPEGAPLRGVVHVVHGMAEHGKRYDAFAQHLVSAGVAVYADDHRGHGETAGSADNLGHIADQGGWDLVTQDVFTIQSHLSATHPDVPQFMFGHSWGSMLAREFVIEGGNELAGLILSGVSADPGLKGRAGMALAKSEMKLRGPLHRSVAMDRATFGAFTPRGAATKFDWLSRDPAAVQAYIDDPLCGFVCTSAFFVDLLTGVRRVNDPHLVAQVPSALPILIIGGSADPVGDNGKAVIAVSDQYRDAGVADVTAKLYAGARHELTNETNRAEVIDDIVAWLWEHAPAG